MFSQTSLQSLEPTISYFNMIPRWWILSDPSGHNQRHVKQPIIPRGNDQFDKHQRSIDAALPLKCVGVLAVHTAGKPALSQDIYPPQHPLKCFMRRRLHTLTWLPTVMLGQHNLLKRVA